MLVRFHFLSEVITVTLTRLLIIGATSGLALAMSSVNTFAAGYGSQPGYTVATSQTTCAGAGAFGAFGPGVNWGQDPPGPAGPTGHGADGRLTGSNNSSLCGSPAGQP